MDEVFKALADAHRRLLLDRLHARGGQSLRELCSGMGMTRQSVSKHLATLEEAGLLTTVRRGREKVHYLNVAPLAAMTQRWINKYTRERTDAIVALKAALEQETVDNSAFAYTTYIRTTPERLWEALTDPAFTDQYWGTSHVTDWAKGSPMTWRQHGVEISDPAQIVLEADRPRRLSYTWHTFTSEWAQDVGVDAETLATIKAEPRSQVTFDIEVVPGARLVKLTVVHCFPPGSTVLEMCRHGWPQILSELKTLLEEHPLTDES